MGCAISGPGQYPASGREDVVAVASLSLSDRQTQLVKETWRLVQEDIAKVGIIMFVRLFETHPECKDAFFLFRDIDDLQQLRKSKGLRAHGLRVMSFIEKTVARLDQEDRLQQLALELGKSHFRYSAAPKYYPYVGNEFICAVQPILKEKWTAEVEEAWKGLFHYLTSVMKKGYQDEERGSCPREKPKHGPNSV
ncbi:x globin [Callorhinchus milii]|uniref:GbX1 n=1 Tax=Callorhinchus milii TaxID=7868 RepID=A0A0K1NVN5_CALMI|nr:x globin [Callorhinchus milii]AKU74646.1 GbX1 [Callorhinchus milii]|eukprot:gi/632951594/ref/XP_007891388.1/ PREDICTED: cytoglobin-1-like [Callorhinchus milii]